MPWAFLGCRGGEEMGPLGILADVVKIRVYRIQGLLLSRIGGFDLCEAIVLALSISAVIPP